METSIMLKVKTDLWDTLYIYSDLMIMDKDGGMLCFMNFANEQNTNTGSFSKDFFSQGAVN